MNYYGLFPKYRINRPLSENEVKNRLLQKKRLNVEPLCQLCAIKMNSTFLESVDKWYGWRGSLSLFVLPMIAILVWFTGEIIFATFSEADGWRLSSYDIEILLIVAALMGPSILAAAWLLNKDWFSYTHYPIRFNRKKRLVHVFHPDGTVSTTPWDEVYFTLGHMRQLHEWEVRGHILEPGTSTIQKTFALSYTGRLLPTDVNPGPSGPSQFDYVRSHWEFIRRYMEEGPEAVSNQVQFCMPVDGRRESIRVGTERVFANFSSEPLVLYLMVSPLSALISTLRIFAMRTSKIPVWPDDVEAECKIDVDDPYAIVGDEMGDRVAVYPEAAAAAGVAYRPPVGVGTELRARRKGAKANK